MSNSRIFSLFIASFNKKPIVYVLIVAFLNFIIRLVICYNTVLFRFSDFGIYLDVVDNLLVGKQQYMLDGNFLYGISYIGYFFEKFFGTIDAFFVFNALIGASTSIIIYILIYRVTKDALAGFIAVVLLTVYTEYLVFSSVFYSPVIMVFIVSLILLLLYEFFNVERFLNLVFIGTVIICLFLFSFYFKQELKYLPYLLFLFSIIFFVNHKNIAIKTGILAILMVLANIFFDSSGVITKKYGHVWANDFVFFGHTDYGGDGGEGAFIYDTNRERYEEALMDYRKDNTFVENDRESINKFQTYEIKRFITQHPFGWIKLQFVKFFRTFGVVPEGVSFKILYSGILKNKIWLTSIVIVAPVVLFLVLCIFLSNGNTLKRLLSGRPKSLPFLVFFVALFFYYLLASVFYGHYQERYRITIFVIFIIPYISYLLANFEIKKVFNKKVISIKGVILTIFFIVWINQIVNVLSNKERVNNVIEFTNN